MPLGSVLVKASRKHVGEIDPVYFARFFLFQLFRLFAVKRRSPLSSLFFSSFVSGLRVKTFSRDSRRKLLATKVRVPGR